MDSALLSIQQAGGSNCVVATEPGMSWTNLETLPAQQVVDMVPVSTVAYVSQGNLHSVNPVDFPVLAGETLFVNCDAGDIVVVRIADKPS